MLHALATLLFSMVALASLGAIVALLRSDWEAFTTALGLKPVSYCDSAPLPPKITVRSGRRATMIKLEAADSRWRAAA